MALGGARDKSGFVDPQRLSKVVKEDFGMTLKIDVRRIVFFGILLT